MSALHQGLKDAVERSLFAHSAQPEAPAAKEAKVNILLVDDSPSNLLSLQSMLQHPEYDLVCADSGEDALRRLLGEEFALVLLDVQMPGMDGFDTAALMRSRERSSYTPIIFVTAFNTNDTHVNRGYSMGAVDYIFKPIMPEILRAKVQVFVELFKKSRQVRENTLELYRINEALRLEIISHHRAQRALRASEEKYRRLFSSAGEAILMADAGTERLFDANEAALKLYGYELDELLQLRLRDLQIDPSSPDIFLEPRVVRQKRKEGATFPAEVNETELSLEGRRVRIVFARDVTERQKASEMQQLLEREALEREFVAHVSHELRTPIAAIKGFAETLRQGAIRDVSHRMKFVRAIERNSDRLCVLVEDLLVIASLESGKIKPCPKTLALRAFVEKYVDSIAPLASRRGVSIEIDVPTGIKVRADRKQLSQILQNLLDNALKYNRPGGKVRVDARAKDLDAHVSIQDTGIGISEEDIPRLFTRFHRCQQARVMDIHGTGLGLYIIKNLVESNGGRIWVESEKGRGSCFHFTVPLA